MHSQWCEILHDLSRFCLTCPVLQRWLQVRGPVPKDLYNRTFGICRSRLFTGQNVRCPSCRPTSVWDTEEVKTQHIAVLIIFLFLFFLSFLFLFPLLHHLLLLHHSPTRFSLNRRCQVEARRWLLSMFSNAWNLFLATSIGFLLISGWWK